MRITCSEDAGALYLLLRPGDVERTLEVDEMVYLDLDKDGAVLGLEFVHAEDFLPFLLRHQGQYGIPEQIDLTSLAQPPTTRNR